MSSLDSQSSDPVLFGVIMGQEFYMWVLEVYDSALGVEKKTKESLDKHSLHGKHWIISQKF